MAQPRNKKYDAVAAMYGAGMSVGELAEHYGVTRQAMWKIVKRRTETRKKLTLTDNEYGRQRARWLVKSAVRRGVLSRGACERCGNEKAHAHHDDYNKPLAVRWLCQRHHWEWHTQNVPIPLAR